MVIIEGIIGEAEIDAMSDDMIICLGKLLDDKIALAFLEYTKNPNANAKVKDRVLSLIGDKIYKYTFHLEVLESGVIDTIRSLSLDNIAYGTYDRDATLQQLQFLEDNKVKLHSYIDPRKSSDYKDFLKMISTLHIDNPEFPDLYNRVKANKDYFCSKNERQRSTKVGVTISRMTDWEIALSGIKFLKYCDKNNVSDWNRREF